MLESLPFTIVIGTALGFLSGLGIGGGSLLIVWLAAVLQKDPFTARLINLMFFIPSALIACIIRIRKNQLEWKTVLPAILSGCGFALAGWWISTQIEVKLLKKLFGIILLAAGLKELLYRPRNAR